MYSVLYAHACTLVLLWAPASSVLAHTVFLLAHYILGVLYIIKKNALFWDRACHLSVTQFQ
jgi:hypothetical protein